MKTRFKLYLLTFLLFVVIFLLQKPLFMLCNLTAFKGSTFAEWMKVMWNGLPLDIALAGLLSIVPGILLLCTIWSRKKLWRRLGRIYFLLVSILLSWVFVRHLGFSSLVLAIIVGVVLTILLFALFWYFLLRKDTLEKKWLPLNPLLFSLLFVIITALLALPAGAWLSRPAADVVAFCDRQVLNDAAINPLTQFTGSFGFKPAISINTSKLNPFKSFKKKSKDVEKQVADESLLPALLDPQVAGADTSAVAGAQKHVDVLNNNRPNVLLVLPTTMKGETLGDGGLRFRNIFATGTDNQLVSVLAGCLASEEAEAMKAGSNAATLVGSLRAENYLAAFYTGQDIDANGLRSWLTASGFQGIVSKNSFSAALSANGSVADQDVVQTLVGELQKEKTRRPWLRAIQLTDDSAVESLVGQLGKLPQWSNTLVVALATKPTAAGNKPSLQDVHVPLIMTGGALKGPGNIDIYGSQADIVATILGQMGLNHGAFTHSKDILNPASPHFAFFANDKLAGMATAENHYILDKESGKTLLDEGKAKGQNEAKCAAFGASLKTNEEKIKDEK